MHPFAFPVVIAGGGIGGLATALALSRRGIPAHVFERRAAFSEEGAGIQIGPNGTRVLRALGLEDDLRAHVAEPKGLVVHDARTGRILNRFPLGSWIAERHGSAYWTIHRQDLHAVLLAHARAAAGVTIATGEEIATFSQRGAAIDMMTSADGTIAASALIAADGIWSRLRDQISGSRVDLRPTGKCAYRGVIKRHDLPDDRDCDDIHIWLAPGAHAVHYPVRAGREVAIAVIVDDTSSTTGWSTPAQKVWIDAHRHALPDELAALLHHVESWRMWALHTPAPAVSRWTSGRAALLGDAAHPILPFLAQGAVLALEDAVSIAAHIAASPSDIDGALAAYERDRRARATRVALASEQNGRIYHLGGAMALARNGVLRSMPGGCLMARYDWLYGGRT
jgi:salicylate hydroxylase